MTPLVNRGLQAIHDRINSADFSVHDADRDAVIEMLARLHQAGEPLRTLEIEEWAIEHGWHAYDARQIGELALLIDQKDIPPHQESWPDNIVEQLRAQIDSPVSR